MPPFSAELGRKVIEDELNIRIDDVFSELSPEPVASASIGQVYRGTIRETGEEVAVKVQVGAGVDFELQSNSLTFECENPRLSVQAICRTWRWICT